RPPSGGRDDRALCGANRRVVLLLDGVEPSAAPNLALVGNASWTLGCPVTHAGVVLVADSQRDRHDTLRPGRQVPQPIEGTGHYSPALAERAGQAPGRRSLQSRT